MDREGRRAAEGGLGINHPVVAMQTAEKILELLVDRREQQRDRRTQIRLRRWRRFEASEELAAKDTTRELLTDKKKRIAWADRIDDDLVRTSLRGSTQ